MIDGKHVDAAARSRRGQTADVNRSQQCPAFRLGQLLERFVLHGRSLQHDRAVRAATRRQGPRSLARMPAPLRGPVSLRTLGDPGPWAILVVMAARWVVGIDGSDARSMRCDGRVGHGRRIATCEITALGAFHVPAMMAVFTAKRGFGVDELGLAATAGHDVDVAIEAATLGQRRRRRRAATGDRGAGPARVGRCLRRCRPARDRSYRAPASFVIICWAR